MKKPILLGILTVLLICFSVVFYYKQVDLSSEPNKVIANKGDQKETKKEETKKTENQYTSNQDEIKPSVDLSICNENGKIMVLMYQDFDDSQKDAWTRSFSNFKNDLKTLYEKNYYPISMTDYLNGNIDVPYGKTPIVLTFDDGKASQLSFERVNGELIPKEKTAVAIYETFCKEHIDFPMKGTFYIMASNFFGSIGSLGQRLQYLVNDGFEIGNQTMNHYALPKADTVEKIQEEVGGLAKFVDSYIPGYKINSFSIPGGSMTQKFASAVYSGTYDGFAYENKGVVLLFNSYPAKSPINKELDLKRIPRILVSSKDKNFEYWIQYFDEHPEEKYVSDGDAKTFVISEADKGNVDTSKYSVKIK